MIKVNSKQRLFEMMSHVNPDFKLNEEVVSSDINKILSGYIEAALFTEEERLESDRTESDYNPYNDDDAEDEMEKLIMITNNFKHKPFESFTRQDITPNSLITAYSDIKKFLAMAGDSVDEAIESNGLDQLGMDIWYTRNHHGSGFFDRSYDYDTEKKLIEAGHALGEVDLYLTNNNLLAFGNED